MTMLKYRVASYEAGKKLKEAIKRRADENDFITLKEVDNVLCPSAPSDPDAEKVGWRWSDLKGMNLYVRMCRFGEAVAQPYLYICEPTIDVHKITEGPEINMELIDSDNKGIFEMNPDGIRIEIPSEEAKDKAFLDYMFENMKEILANNRDGRRKCIIWKKSRKKDVVADGVIELRREEWPCWFHCWASNRIVKEDGTVVDQLLAVCEYQDGHVERISFDHIRFVEEWE